jgi:hypothetical protein
MVKVPAKSSVIVTPVPADKLFIVGVGALPLKTTEFPVPTLEIFETLLPPVVAIVKVPAKSSVIVTPVPADKLFIVGVGALPLKTVEVPVPAVVILVTPLPPVLAIVKVPAKSSVIVTPLPAEKLFIVGVGALPLKTAEVPVPAVVILVTPVPALADICNSFVEGVKVMPLPAVILLNVGIGDEVLVIKAVPVPTVETLVTKPDTLKVTVFAAGVNVIPLPAIKLFIVGVGAAPFPTKVTAPPTLDTLVTAPVIELLIVNEVPLSVKVTLVPATKPLILGVGADPEETRDVPPALEILVTAPVIELAI